MGTGEDFARMLAERKGISVEEHLRRMAQEREERAKIAQEEGIEEEGTDDAD